jgi:CheY-like chemotaxis protein
MIDAVPLPSSDSANGPLRVLVVEDEKVNQLVVLGMLRQMAHPADCVADGIEALEALRRQNYDIVLMDVRMPNMDGIEATQRIRGLSDPVAQIPIIALTANATTEERLRCAEAGMNDFISKPFRRADLEITLEKWRPREGEAPAGDRPSPGHLAAPK